MGTAHLSFGMCHAHHLGCPLPFLSHHSTNINILTHLQAYAAPSGKCLSFLGLFLLTLQDLAKGTVPEMLTWPLSPAPSWVFPFFAPHTFCASFWAHTYVVLTLSPQAVYFWKSCPALSNMVASIHMCWDSTVLGLWGGREEEEKIGESWEKHEEVPEGPESLQVASINKSTNAKIL